MDSQAPPAFGPLQAGGLGGKFWGVNFGAATPPRKHKHNLRKQEVFRVLIMLWEYFRNTFRLF